MPTSTKLNRARYRKVIWFFARVFVHAIWWDLLLRRIPLVRLYVNRSALTRWRRIARRFRTLAVEMGGVMIKLGQFLSIRVDVLPIEVIQELADLQDEVPAEDFERIAPFVEAEFGRLFSQVFELFESKPLAAASLAQTHRARLLDGREVVVKVQRPGIDVLVHTDLAAIAVAIRWLKFYPRVSRRVNLDWLAKEFTTVTANELDFVAEAKNAERFRADFRDDQGVYVPQIYWEYSLGRVLTMENVAYIRIGDLAAITAAGISRGEVAKKLYNIYMRQVFITHVVHADPHPGNLFVRALSRPADLSPDQPTPFQIIFVDFGMVAEIPERLRSALRDYAIGVGTRDAHRMVQAYVEADVLLPGADLKRLEEAHQVIFDRFWGTGMRQMRDLALTEADFFLKEYRDLVYEAPFQFQVDILFVARAVGLLSGMATNLDQDFDPWAETIPFAESLAREQLQRSLPEIGLEIVAVLRAIAAMPTKLDQVLTQAQRGSLTIENAMAPDTRRAVRGLEAAVNRLTWAVVFLAVVLTGVVLRISEQPNWFNSLLLVVAAWIFVTRVWRV
jgi:predicted unusual protein kinase regulating ubiquinone biosynthesis (AarF/ABC1/UbiB family)